MGRRLLLCSMLVLVMLLLMPSIPAIQQKSIEDIAYNDLGDRLEDFYFENIKEFKKLSDGFWSEHPILGLLFYLSCFRLERVFKFVFYSVDFGNELGDRPIILHTLILLKALWLIGTSLG